MRELKDVNWKTKTKTLSSTESVKAVRLESSGQSCGPMGRHYAKIKRAADFFLIILICNGVRYGGIAAAHRHGSLVHHRDDCVTTTEAQQF